MIQECTPCKPHEFQDKRYGKGMRVHTPFTKSLQPMARCTVCLTEKPTRGTQKFAPAKPA